QYVILVAFIYNVSFDEAKLGIFAYKLLVVYKRLLITFRLVI
ncbi:MAG: hypothetical protein JWP78_431, partial [Mucilaginibacter sp.]|nr:hypothetical protein [Mucilaginibacter sp.]